MAYNRYRNHVVLKRNRRIGASAMDILSKNNAVPLYEQLKLSLRKQIDQRILP